MHTQANVLLEGLYPSRWCVVVVVWGSPIDALGQYVVSTILSSSSSLDPAQHTARRTCTPIRYMVIVLRGKNSPRSTGPVTKTISWPTEELLDGPHSSLPKETSSAQTVLQGVGKDTPIPSSLRIPVVAIGEDGFDLNTFLPRWISRSRCALADRL